MKVLYWRLIAKMKKTQKQGGALDKQKYQTESTKTRASRTKRKDYLQHLACKLLQEIPVTKNAAAQSKYAPAQLVQASTTASRRTEPTQQRGKHVEPILVLTMEHFTMAIGRMLEELLTATGRRTTHTVAAVPHELSARRKQTVGERKTNVGDDLAGGSLCRSLLIGEGAQEEESNSCDEFTLLSQELLQ
ncbi:hypothetical protein LXL04_003178 [Taraxacum kok-saghyz]